MRNSVVCVAIAVMAIGCATPEPSSSIDDATIRSATQQWINAYNSCTDPGTIASLYESDALLWGTASTNVVSAPDALRQYFVRACTSTPKSTVELGPFVVRSYGDTGTSSGVYTFTIFRSGQPRAVPARFSFTFRRAGDRWLIVSHHSSQLPSPPAPPPQRQ